MIPTGAIDFICKVGMPLPAPPCLPCWVAGRNKPDEPARQGLEDLECCVRAAPLPSIQNKHVQPRQHRRLQHAPKRPGWSTPRSCSAPLPYVPCARGLAKTR